MHKSVFSQCRNYSQGSFNLKYLRAPNDYELHLQLVLHRVWNNRASSGLEHARKWKFEFEHARALENSTWSSFCPGIWLKMLYFCQNLPIFKGSFASSIKRSSIEYARASKIDFGRAFFGLEHARVQLISQYLQHKQHLHHFVSFYMKFNIDVHAFEYKSKNPRLSLLSYLKYNNKSNENHFLCVLCTFTPIHLINHVYHITLEK